MPLGDNLVDDLVPTVDELRAELYRDMGITQHTVRAIRRQWSGSERGQGSVAITNVLVLSPPPLFIDKTKLDLMSHGKVDVGDAMLKEVSLTYTEADLTGGTLERNEEFYFEVIDSRGQDMRPTYYRANGPFTDREKSIGWMVPLVRVDVKNP